MVVDVKAKILRRYDLDMAIRYVAEKTSSLSVNDPNHFYYFNLTIDYMTEGGCIYYDSLEQNFLNFFACIIANEIEYKNIKVIIDKELDFYMRTGNIEKARKATSRNKLFEL